MNYRLWEHTFTSVTGYYKYNYNQNLDLDGTPLAAAATQAPEQYYQVSQEFRAHHRPSRRSSIWRVCISRRII